MKNIRYFLSAVFIISTLSGCASDWNQDPLAGKDQAFKNGQQKPTLPEKPEATDSKAVRLDANDFYSFREGIAGDFKMSARILEAGYTPTIYIDNMGDFPGANFDAATGKFTWTPPQGTISGNNGLEEKRILKVHVVGNKPNGKVLTSEFPVELRVGKQLSVPEIFSISKTSVEMREGEMTSITVKVRDRDAGTGFPNLQILPITGQGNISHFVTITQMLATGNNEYVINLNVDLTDAELTKSRDRYGFKLIAVSRFQQVSANQDVYINVATSFADLQSTWFDFVEVPLGLKKDYQFMFFDPKGELFVTAPTFTGLPSGANMNCSGVNVTRQLCTFSWTPDFTVTTGDINVTAVVRAKNQDSKDLYYKDYTFPLKLRVTSAPPVSPVSLKGGQ